MAHLKQSVQRGASAKKILAVYFHPAKFRQVLQHLTIMRCPQPNSCDARQALGEPEREVTLGADKGYDAQEFIDACMDMKVTPHVAQNKSGRKSAVPDAIAQSERYKASQRKRKLIEQGFGWAKTVGGIRQVKVRGLKRVDQMFVLTMAAYNLVRMRKLLGAA